MSQTAFKYSTVKKKKIKWLWHPFIQRGAINLLTGGPGTGKSTIACDIAAALSVGRPLPGETQQQATERGVLKTWIFNAEDDPEDTIVWRLSNQEADLDKIYGRPLSGAISFSIIKEILDFIKEAGIDLIVIDPVQAWVPADTDMHRANQMREWGNLFRQLCLETGVTVLWVRHRRKGDADDAGSINSGLGSIDMSGIVRSEIGAVTSKKGSKIVRIKGSVGQTGLQLSYAITPMDEVGNDHGQLRWDGDISRAPGVKDDRPARSRSKVDPWLISMLTNGPALQKDVIDAATKLGYGESTIRGRAGAKGNIAVSYVEDGRAFWRLRKPDDIDDSTDTPAD